MSLILALDTSTDQGSAALLQGTEVLCRVCPPGPAHSATLLPLVESLMAEAGVAFPQLDALAFGAGPGMFTGLRMACACVQGLAVAHDRPILPVGSLETLAEMALTAQGNSLLPGQHAPLADPLSVMALLDARMGEVYSGYFRWNGVTLEAVAPVGVGAPAQCVWPGQATFLVCGNGLLAYPQGFPPLPAGAIPVPAVQVPRADGVARLAQAAFLRGEGLDAAEVAPVYVRDKVAQTTAERLAAGGRA